MTKKNLIRMLAACAVCVLAAILLCADSAAVAPAPAEPTVTPDAGAASQSVAVAGDEETQYKADTDGATVQSDVFGAAGTDAAVAGENAYGEEKGSTNPREHYMNANAIKASLFDNIPTIDNGQVSKDFIIEIQRHGYAPYNTMLQDASVLGQRIGDTALDFVHGTECYEWYSNTVMNTFQGVAQTRQDCIDIMQDWLKSRFGTHLDDGSAGGGPESPAAKLPKSTMDSYTSMQHYVAEAGFDYIGHEIGVTVSSFGMRIAFTRGAAKQFKEDMGNGTVNAWWLDYSLWTTNGMVDYSNFETWQDGDLGIWGKPGGTHSNPLSGQSISACRRGYYLTYMSGAKWLINEAGGQCSFLPVVNEETGWYELSAHGIMNQEFYDFVQRNSERGSTYVPFALVLDYEHGMPYADWKTPAVFEMFALEDGDKMNMNIMQVIWPGGYPASVDVDEIGQMTATPYGETFDVLLQNANSNILDAYKALVLSGEIDFKAGEMQRYVDYVNNGGTLVMNVAYKADFAGTALADLAVGEHKVGNGRVIVYGEKNYSIDGLADILAKLEAEYVPVTVSNEGAEYIVNLTDDSVIVTVFNNNGIINANDTQETVFPSEIMEVAVEYVGVGEVSQVNDWITGEVLETSAEQVLTIGPGDLAIIEFVL